MHLKQKKIQETKERQIVLTPSWWVESSLTMSYFFSRAKKMNSHYIQLHNQFF